jgi:hypothetical protein
MPTRRKADGVLGERERRMAALDAARPMTPAVQAHTVHDTHPLLADALVARCAALERVLAG